VVNVLNFDAQFVGSYPTTGSTWYDVSGNGNTFDLFNGPSFNPNGYITTDGVDDYLSSTNPQSVSNISGSDPFTFSALFKLTQYANQRLTDSENYSSLLMKGSYNPSFGISLGYSLPSGGVFTRAKTYSGVRNLSLPSTASGYGHPNQTSNTDFALNRWYQVDFTSEFLGTTYTFKTYINGNLDITSTSTLSTYPVAFQNNSNLTVATSPLAGNGIIAPINIAKGAIYKKTLSQAEINQNYYQAPIVTNGLVFALDAGNLVSYESGSTSTYSMTGSISGSLINGTSYNSGNGGSWVFDGVDDYVDTTFKASISIGNGNPFTISAFFKTGNTTQQMLVTCPDSPRFYIEVFNRSGVLVSHWGIGNNNNSSTSTAIINLNQIYNYVTTYDGNIAKGYLNGVLTDTDTIGSQSYNTNFLQIGKYANFLPLYLSGSIYTTQIYNRALTDSEVLQNFNAQKGRFGL
jgi:hypothetical protein